MSGRRGLPEAPHRRGWCPSLARPMPTGDGLLARIHPPLGVLTLAQARAVARGARTFGNGQIDVTARANLQIRGVTETTGAALARLLDAAGLGDVRSDGGPQRLTLTPPLAGADVVALARAIEALGLGMDGLPAKTLVGVEDARSCPEAGLMAVDADIRLVVVEQSHEARAGLPLLEGDGWGEVCDLSEKTSHLTLSLSFQERGPALEATSPSARGMRPVAGLAAGVIGVEAHRVVLALAGPDGPDWFAPVTHCRALAAVDTALATLAAGGARRMRDLAPGARAGLVHGLGLTALAEAPRAEAMPMPGLTDLGDDRTAILVDAPFGRCGADDLDRLIHHAESLGSDIHLSPSRGFALVADGRAEARTACDALARDGFVTQADDPRGAVAACPGAPACASGSTPTLRDAARLAEAFRPFAERGRRAHVSGCAKGCAHPAAADLTLVGDGGLYGLVLGGSPGMVPALRLTFEAALERLRTADPRRPLDHAFRTPS